MQPRSLAGVSVRQRGQGAWFASGSNPINCVTPNTGVETLNSGPAVLHLPEFSTGRGGWPQYAGPDAMRRT